MALKEQNIVFLQDVVVGFTRIFLSRKCDSSWYHFEKPVAAVCMILCPFCPIKDDTEAAKRSWQTCECDAADGVAVRPDDLHRLVFGELHQQQIAPSSADPESCSALHQQGLHSGPGRRSLHGPTRIMSAETQQRSRHLYAIAKIPNHV